MTRPTFITALTLKPRIASIDIMRGIVMIIMALDHTRDYFHADASLFDPTDLSKTSPALFFTRLITHFCAPTFVFLSGISARVNSKRKSKGELSLFLLTRGFWLIVLELTVVRFSLFFNPYYDLSMLQVIWVIGASMVVLAALIHLPEKMILAIGLILIFGHNLFDLIPLKPEDSAYAFWAVLQQAGMFAVGPQNFVHVPYPLIPWLGIMVTGYGMGFLFDADFDEVKRGKVLRFTGIVALVLFVVLRFTGFYGDPTTWTVEKNSLFTFMSFINVTKYPVSLLYTLMTLGPVLIILSWMEHLKKGILEPVNIIGRVPLFYYILHFYVIHASGLLVYMITTGTPWSAIDFHFNKGFGGLPPGAGSSLIWVYVAWLLIVITIYPMCKWYYNYKSTHSQWWLSYL